MALYQNLIPKNLIYLANVKDLKHVAFNGTNEILFRRNLRILNLLF